MFTVDQRAFKNDVHALIDDIEDDPPETGDDFIPQVVRFADSYGIVISAAEFGAALFKLIRERNASRAHKLVDALDDHSLTLVGFAARTVGKIVLKFGSIAAFIVFVVWAYNNCGS